MATDFSIPTTRVVSHWPDAAIGHLLTTKGMVYLALCFSSGDSWAFEQLVVKFQGYVFYKHGINVTFVFRGEESELVFVPMKQVTSAGLLKAADAFLIELDDV